MCIHIHRRSRIIKRNRAQNTDNTAWINFSCNGSPSWKTVSESLSRHRRWLNDRETVLDRSYILRRAILAKGKRRWRRRWKRDSDRSIISNMHVHIYIYKYVSTCYIWYARCVWITQVTRNTHTWWRESTFHNYVSPSNCLVTRRFILWGRSNIFAVSGKMDCFSRINHWKKKSDDSEGRRSCKFSIFIRN